MAEEICGPNACLIGQGPDGKPTYAPAGTPFIPGTPIGKATDDPTPSNRVDSTRCGENDCTLSFGAGSGDLYGPQQSAEPFLLPWPFVFPLLLIVVLAIRTLFKAGHRRSRSGSA